MPDHPAPFTPPSFSLPATWENVVQLFASADFTERALPALLREARWFGGKAHPLREVRAWEFLRVGGDSAGALVLIEAIYVDRPSEIYMLPLQLAPSAPVNVLVIARLEGGVLFDALHDERFRDALFEMILREKNVHGTRGICGATLPADLAGLALPLASRALAVEQSNSAIIYDGRYFLKLYRKPEPGENPDAELIRFLSEKQGFAHVPAFCGAIEHCGLGDAHTLALLVANVPSEGDAWAFTLAHLHDESYPARVQQLGERTAGMHLALAADTTDPAFAPEPFTPQDQHALCESAKNAAQQTMELLAKKLPEIPDAYRPDAEALLARVQEIPALLATLAACEVRATKTRHHGDYHLGQVLNTGSDFIIIDFEGEPARSLAERRMKRSPLRDVAGMLRSFHYAAHSAPATRDTRDSAEAWARKTARIFLDAWLATAKGATFIPEGPRAFDALLQVHLIEKAIYEISYELNHRPGWVFIPVRGVLQILDDRLTSQP